MNKAWPMVPLGEVLIERKEVPSAESLANGDIRIVAKIGFNDGKIQLRSGCETKTGMILARPGDLLISGINAAKGAIAIYGEENTEPIAATIHYGAYIPKKDRVDVRYLWWLLRSNTFRDHLQKFVPGGIKTELKAKRLLPIPVPLPSLEEQHRILAIIEQFAAKINEAQGLRATASRKAEVLIKAQLSKITERFDSFGTLGAVLYEKPRNGWSARCDNSEDGIPVLTLKAITGYQYDSTAYKKTSLPTDLNAHYWLKPGDLLVTRSNTREFVGHAAIYNGLPKRCIYSDLMMRVPVDEQLAEKRFVWYWLQTPFVKEFIEANAKGTSPTMKKISQGTVTRIPFPGEVSIEEQRRIVQYLDGLQAKVNQLKVFQPQTSVELDVLMPSILDKAFKGEL
jgi:type I restriction enzyme S subunit